MAIPITCGCGRSFEVEDELAGKGVCCPGCGAMVTAPRRDPEVNTEGVPDLRLARRRLRKLPRLRRRQKWDWSRFSVEVHPLIITGGVMILGAVLVVILALAFKWPIIPLPIGLFALGVGSIILGFRGD